MESTTLKSTLPEAGKTPTMPSKGTYEAAVVDGDNEEVRCDKTPNQGLHIFFPTYVTHGIPLDSPICLT